jgi:16S rRNA (adenine1518-N6/adenine1519-N6)-dimethyltransferase
MSAERREPRGGPSRRPASVAGHGARKRFGQHFLADRSVLESIVSAIRPQRGDHMVEIGPGLAALTGPLLDRIDRLFAVEIDRDLCARLRGRWPAERLVLLEGDALSVDLAPVLGPPGESASLRIVGNLPYNISTPLLIRLLDLRDRVVDQHFLLQKEVVDRVVAEPGSSDYGRLSVLLQACYQVEKVFDVPPEAFDPPPRVESSLLRMVVLERPLTEAISTLQQVLAVAFSQRRKMLRGTLLPWLESRGLDPAGIDGTMRAEDLDVRAYCALADSLRSISSIL